MLISYSIFFCNINNIATICVMPVFKPNHTKFIIKSQTVPNSSSQIISYSSKFITSDSLMIWIEWRFGFAHYW